MKVTKIEGGKTEKQILTAMVGDKLVLSRISAQWRDKPFESKLANIVGQLCVNYYNKYNKCPKDKLGVLYNRWAETSNDKDTIKLVGNLVDEVLETLENKKKFDPEFETDQAEDYFNKVHIKRTSDEAQKHFEGGDLEKARRIYESCRKIELRKNGVVNMGGDYSVIEQAFTFKKRQGLVTYPGALGEFFGDFFQKDAFIAFMGADKRGKSFWLLDIAYRGWKQGKKVAFFVAGDMTQDQVIRRIGARCSNKPFKQQTYKYPTKISREGDMATVESEVVKAEEGITVEEAWKAIKKTQKRSGRKPGNFKMHFSPAGTLSIHDLRGHLEAWKREYGFVPEIIILDYADLLAPPPKIEEFRHQTNKIWEQLRALSQELNCLVVTATQANAASYRAELLGRWNFSEDKRKLAHVSGFVGLNANKREQERGIMRLNWIVLREGEFNYSKCVHVASCLAVANPAVLSCW